MEFLVDSKKMKAIDNYTINELGIPSMVLMERAAFEVVKVIEKNIDKNSKILSVCGVGNNGGDGIAAARILAGKGYDVTIYIIGNKTKMSVETRQQLAIAKNMQLKIYNEVYFENYDVIIDAIFGIGLDRAIEGDFYNIIQSINNTNAKIFSVDIPSGICADNGNVLNIAIKADYTITFGLNKKGLVLYDGCNYSKNVIVADIGFPNIAIDYVKPNCCIYNKDDLKLLPNRKARSNKGTFGKVLIIAGSKNMSGACILSAKAAYKTGSGLVKIFTVKDNRQIVQVSLPEAIIDAYEDINLNYENIIENINWADVIVIGPGIGTSENAKDIVKIVCKNANVPTIIDADAINILSNLDDYILPKKTILTPHLKEMSRIIKRYDVNYIMNNIYDVANEFAKEKNCIVVLKDARTIVSNGEYNYINMSGNNGMATGGSGDVLTGIIAGLIAQNMNEFEAAKLSVYIHGLAGDFAKDKIGSFSIIASDIIDNLSEVLKVK